MTKQKMQEMKKRWAAIRKKLLIRCVVMIVIGVVLFVVDAHVSPFYTEENVKTAEGVIAYVENEKVYEPRGSSTFRILVLESGERYHIEPTIRHYGYVHFRWDQYDGSPVTIKYADWKNQFDSKRIVEMYDLNNIYMSMSDSNKTVRITKIMWGVLYVLVFMFVILLTPDLWEYAIVMRSNALLKKSKVHKKKENDYCELSQ